MKQRCTWATRATVVSCELKSRSVEPLITIRKTSYTLPIVISEQLTVPTS
jgi:hypothetical protein